MNITNYNDNASTRTNSHERSEQATEIAAPLRNNNAFDLRSIIGLLRRQLNLILVTVAFICGITGAVAISLTPVYRSTALVFVDPSRKNLLDPSTQMSSSASDSAKVDSEVEIVKSDGVLTDVIATQNLVSDPEFGVRLGLKAKVMAFLRLKPAELPSGAVALGGVRNKLRRAVSVQRRGLTYLISIGASSTSPQKAADLANAVASAYIQRQVQSKVAGTLAARDTIDAQIAKARQAVVDGETAYNKYISENLDVLASETGRTDLREMRDALQTLIAQQQGDTAEMQAIRQGIAQSDITEISQRLQDEASAALRTQREELIKQVGAAETGSAAQTNLQQELANVERQLIVAAEARAAELELSLSQNEAQITDVRQNLNSALLRSNLPPDIQARIYELLQVTRNATSNYQSLLARLQDLETQALIQVADSRVVSEALAPTTASFPNIPVILAAAAFLASGIGVGLGFLFENYVGGITSGAQLESLTGRRLASTVPIQKKDAAAKSVADAIVDAPLSRYAESVRRLRVAADRAYKLAGAFSDKKDRQKMVIMITSAVPAEGKTTIALSLARTYALDGRRVLLIDCDLRKPSVHKHLNLEPENSLADFLGGNIPRHEIKNIAVRDPRSTLAVIQGARRAGIPTDRLLQTSRFASLLNSTSRSFDVVILDSPPIDPIVDGIYLAEHADVILFVVRAASTSQSLVTRSIAALSDAKRPDTEIQLALNLDSVVRADYNSSYGQYYTES